MTDMKVFFLFVAIILASWWDSHRIGNLEKCIADHDACIELLEQDND